MENVAARERTLEVRSRGLDACLLAFADCDQVVEDLRSILRGWQVREVGPECGPAVVRLKRARDGYLRISPWSCTPSKCHEAFRTHNTDALFGVHYDLLRWYVEAERGPCLHCAAVRFGSGLVVFPNTSKAGKSTLAIRLAIAGHQIFSDDWLSIRQPGNVGMALGILPWLRLPAPAGVRDQFRRFLADRRGPRNRRWTYVDLRDGELAPHGATAPVRALVLLDRRARGRARLVSLTKDQMMIELIKQNYARQVPVMEAFDTLLALTRNAECCSLQYASVSKAADLLRHTFGGPDHDELRH